MIVFSPRVDAILSLLGIFLAVLLLYMVGILGFLKDVPQGIDFGVFYKAGQLFINGGNPWLDLMNTGEPFSYPPHGASVLSVYGLLSHKYALFLHNSINILSIAVLAYLANKWYLKITDWHTMNFAQGLGLAIIIGNPFMMHSLFLGEMVMPATAMVMLSWHYLKSEHVMLAGLFLGLATIKPQVAFLYVLWLILNLEIRMLLVGGLTALLLMIPALIIYGPIGTFQSWITSFSGYYDVAANMPGSVHVVGLDSFFTAIGILGLGWMFKTLGLIFLYLLYVKQEHFNPFLLIHYALIISLTFLFGHDTDYTAIIMLWSFMIFSAINSGSYKKLAVALLLLLFFFFPQSFLREIDVAALHHTRTFLVPLCGYFAYKWYKENIEVALSATPDQQQ